MKKSIKVFSTMVVLAQCVLFNSSAKASIYNHHVFSCESAVSGEISTNNTRSSVTVDSIVTSDLEYLGWKIQIRDHHLESLLKPQVTLNASTDAKFQKFNPFGYQYVSYVGELTKTYVVMVSPRITSDKKGVIAQLSIVDKKTMSVKYSYDIFCNKITEKYQTSTYDFNKN